jgi:hypothetical protein
MDAVQDSAEEEESTMHARKPKASCLAVVATLVAATIGCSDVLWDEGLGLTVTFSDSVVTPDQPVLVTLTAMNLGDSVVWGTGSSSCQLDAFVLIGAEERRIDVLRGCTDDLATQGLGRGDARTERWPWNGAALIEGAADTLPAGVYEVVAVAGEVARSEPRTIRVQHEEDS